MKYDSNKGFRLLDMYEKLNKGEGIKKSEMATQYGVAEKTIQRDIQELRDYLAEKHLEGSRSSIEYDRTRGGYYLFHMEREWLTKEEVLIVCKILLESRSLCKSELDTLIAKLLAQVSPEGYQHVSALIKNEQFYYVAPRHNKSLFSAIWELSQYITKKEILQISYRRMDGVIHEHEVKPVAIMFSEYYFYLITFKADNSRDYPTTFRVDRLLDFHGTGKKMDVVYSTRFKEEEFRKCVQFMYCGKLKYVKFEYSGPSLEAVLDRLPTSEIMSEKDGVYTIKAKAYGDGINMWLNSQGAYVKIIAVSDREIRD